MPDREDSNAVPAIPLPPLEPPPRRIPRTILGAFELGQPNISLAIVDLLVLLTGFALWTSLDVRAVMGDLAPLCPLATAASMFAPGLESYSPATALIMSIAVMIAACVAAGVGYLGMMLTQVSTTGAAALIFFIAAVTAFLGNTASPLWSSIFTMAFAWSAILIAIGLLLRPLDNGSLGLYPYSLIRALGIAQGVVVALRVILGPIIFRTPSQASQFRLLLDDATAALDKELEACAKSVEFVTSDASSSLHGALPEQSTMVVYTRIRSARDLIDSLARRSKLLKLDSRIRFNPEEGELAVRLTNALQDALLATNYLEVVVLMLYKVMREAAAEDAVGRQRKRLVARPAAAVLQRVIADCRRNLRAARHAALSGKVGAKTPEHSAEGDLESGKGEKDGSGTTVPIPLNDLRKDVDQLETTVIESLRQSGYGKTAIPSDVIVTSLMLMINGAASFAAAMTVNLVRKSNTYAEFMATSGFRFRLSRWKEAIAAIFTAGAGTSTAMFARAEDPTTEAKGLAKDKDPNGGKAVPQQNGSQHDALGSAFIESDENQAASGNARDYVIGGPDRHSRLVRFGIMLGHESSLTVARAAVSFLTVALLAFMLSLPGLVFINAFIGSSFVFTSNNVGKAIFAFGLRSLMVIPGILLGGATFAATGGDDHRWAAFAMAMLLATPFVLVQRIPVLGSASGIAALFIVESLTMYVAFSKIVTTLGGTPPSFAAYGAQVFVVTACGALNGLLVTFLVSPKLASSKLRDTVAAAAFQLLHALLRLRVVMSAGAARRLARDLAQKEPPAETAPNFTGDADEDGTTLLGSADELLSLDRAAMSVKALADGAHEAFIPFKQLAFFAAREPKVGGTWRLDLHLRLQSVLRATATSTAAWAHLAAAENRRTWSRKELEAAAVMNEHGLLDPGRQGSASRLHGYLALPFATTVLRLQALLASLEKGTPLALFGNGFQRPPPPKPVKGQPVPSPGLEALSEASLAVVTGEGQAAIAEILRINDNLLSRSSQKDDVDLDPLGSLSRGHQLRNDWLATSVGRFLLTSAALQVYIRCLVDEAVATAAELFGAVDVTTGLGSDGELLPLQAALMSGPMGTERKNIKLE